MKLKNVNRKFKKIKRSIRILSIADAGLITSTVLTGGISIAALASGFGLPVGISLGAAQPIFSLITPATRKYLASPEKNDSIKLLAQDKLDSIANIILQATQDGDISPTEFHRILQ